MKPTAKLDAKYNFHSLQVRHSIYFKGTSQMREDATKKARGMKLNQSTEVY